VEQFDSIDALEEALEEARITVAFLMARNDELSRLVAGLVVGGMRLESEAQETL